MRARTRPATKTSPRGKKRLSPEPPLPQEATFHPPDTTHPAPESSSFVVGVGASAGGLAAVTELLKHVPSAVGLTIVIIQHLDPKHGSLTASILSRVSSMPVDEVKDGMRTRPNHVYVIPPNSNMRLLNGVLKLSPRTETRGQHLPIDVFFRSLAEDRKEHAIGIVLSGIASDGTLGVQAIKSEGGFTFAQDPMTAQYDGMPRSAILSGAVDIVETPEGIAREITKMSGLLSAQPAGVRMVIPEITTRGPNGSLRKIFAAIRSATGVDFTHYKHSTIQRRIGRRLFLVKIEDLQTYAAYLASHPEEVKALFADILIHVTGFFRDPEAYETLKTRVLPKYFENWDPDVPFRVWVPGCSTGEEVYSIAIAFFEYLDKVKVRPALQIFASDISDPSLQNARSGTYPESIVKDVSKARLNRFFEKREGGGYRIAKWVRDTCLFARHDVTVDPPFARIDLISCRNVLIYFSSELQKRVVPVLHYALNPGGILWLGRSETISGFGNLFTTEHKTDKFYFKKTGTAPVRFQFPISRTLPEVLAVRKLPRAATTLIDVQLAADRIAIEQYAPPGVVINDAAEILQVRGRPAPYLELAPGQASLNLFKLANVEILSDLRYLIDTVRKDNAAARKDGLTLKSNGERRSFAIRVIPLHLVPLPQGRYFSIFFEEAGSSGPVQSRDKGRKTPLKNSQPGEQQHQQRDDWKYQQDLIEEYETTQEELISSNEELQSTNEELQSSNEELETAKEELQSANEEMTTINDELQTRNVEMTQLTNDLTNLLASVDMPIVMVGPDGKIRRFTPKATETLNLIASDVGRSIGDIKPSIDAPDLYDTVAEVMKSLTAKESETLDKQGSWYRLQVRPYRTADNRIDGAVVTLTDITALKHAKEILQIAHDDARKIIDTMPAPILVISSDKRVQAANASFYDMFQVDPAETERRSLSELCDGKWNDPALIAILDTVLNEGLPFHDFDFERDFPRIGHRYMTLHATATRLTGAGSNTALLAVEDFTARKKAADQLRRAEEQFRHLLENANDGVLIVDENGTIEFANRRLEAMFGYSSGELNNRSCEILVPEGSREAYREYHAALMHQSDPLDMSKNLDLFGRHKDGTVFPVEVSLSPVTVESKVLVNAIVRDTSERKKLEDERQELLTSETAARHEAETANLVKDEFLATLSHELRTPLTTILSWAQILRSRKVGPERTAHAMAVIERSAKDQGQLIDDLLDVSRIRAGKMLLELRPIKLADCIEAALESVRSLAEAKSITLQTEFDPSACPIFGDSSRLQQVFRNLFTNAIKFTPSGGKITVRSRRTKDPERLEVQVADSGKGIKPQFLPYLFKRFSQEDSSTKRVFGGLGLGLSIVQTLVEMHGGTVTASSPGEGKGSVFTVSLPCMARRTRLESGRRDSQPGQKAKRRTSQTINLAGLRVLIIDDLEDTREAFSALLESRDVNVEAVSSAAAGLTALVRFKPDVLLCDIAMPGEDGLSFIRKVRALRPDLGGKTPAIALTAYAEAESSRKSLEAGFDAHLPKPADDTDLCRLIATLAGRLKR